MVKIFQKLPILIGVVLHIVEIMEKLMLCGGVVGNQVKMLEDARLKSIVQKTMKKLKVYLETIGRKTISFQNVFVAKKLGIYQHNVHAIQIFEIKKSLI